MIKNIFILVSLALTAPASSLLAQDNIYPSGSNIDSRYTVSDTLISFGDTLTIERRLTNNEAYPLSGVYLTENLPLVFDIIDQTATVDGLAVGVHSEGPVSSGTIDGFNAYRWILDSPKPTENLTRPLGPGEELVIRYRVVSRDIGNFGLPLHTAVMNGNGNGVFALATTDTVRVLISLGTDDDDDIPLPSGFDLVTAYPNPFNGEVSIAFQGGGLANSSIRLDIYNVAGQLVSTRTVRAESDQGILQWAPTANIGSGLYFYRLSSGRQTAEGKLVLVK